jgi:hypothetical protein
MSPDAARFLRTLCGHVNHRVGGTHGDYLAIGREAGFASDAATRAAVRDLEILGQVMADEERKVWLTHGGAFTCDLLEKGF